MLATSFTKVCKLSSSLVQKNILLTSARSFFMNSAAEAKKHHERRLLRFPIGLLYKVVSDVSKYQEFVPWCKASRVLQQNDKEMKAELEVGFQYLTEKYISHVKLQKPMSVIATSNQTNIFEYLISEWKFQSASDPNCTWVTFNVEFKFKLALYNEISEFSFDIF